MVERNSDAGSAEAGRGIMSRKKKNDMGKIIVIAIIILLLFGFNCVQLPTLSGAPNSPQTPTSGGGISGGGNTGGSGTPPAPSDEGDGGGMIFAPINICAMFPSLCAPPPTGDDPYAPTPDLSPENGGAMTQDPCDLNPNQIGCGDTSPDAPDIGGWSFPVIEIPTFTFPSFDFGGGSMLPTTDDGAAAPQPDEPAAVQPAYNPAWHCAGINWGKSYYDPAGVRPYETDCTRDSTCQTYPPLGFTGDPSSLSCCNSQCYDNP
jgi:hypothetical protein